MTRSVQRSTQIEMRIVQRKETAKDQYCRCIETFLLVYQPASNSKSHPAKLLILILFAFSGLTAANLADPEHNHSNMQSTTPCTQAGQGKIRRKMRGNVEKTLESDRPQSFYTPFDLLFFNPPHPPLSPYTYLPELTVIPVDIPWIARRRNRGNSGEIQRDLCPSLATTLSRSMFKPCSIENPLISPSMHRTTTGSVYRPEGCLALLA